LGLVLHSGFSNKVFSFFLLSVPKSRQEKGKLIKCMKSKHSEVIKILHLLESIKIFFLNFCLAFDPRLPDFSWDKIQKREKYTKLPRTTPKIHKSLQMTLKWTKCQPTYTIYQHTPTSSIARPSKIYPNFDFWFENKPSGNLA
jgi:hypothetical protein